jgi:signal transduction histidine kinase/ActR/RegA family two-component response regulator
LAERNRDEGLLRIPRELGLHSHMGVPLTVRGKTLGVITFLTTESSRRFGSADLRLAEDLSHRAAIAVENARLYGELKEADRHKDEFLAMLAHELRNPLAPIRNALHILRMTPRDGSALEQARGVMERQVQHLVRLVDDLLDMSRITRGKIQLRHELVDLATVLSRAVELSRPLIEGNRHHLWVSSPLEPIRLVADPTRLEQVFANLLNNSAKYTERGGSIWLTAEQQGNEVLVRIRDSGFGIPANMLPHIFDLFMQADRTLDRSQGGLGIGLTLAKRLVEMHGGSVTAHSEGPGKGSEFVVRLPLGQEMAQQADTEAPPPAHVSSRGPSPLRILVVDDNKDAADCVAMLLRIWGHDVRTAHEGYSAVKAAHAYRPHVVFLDIGLPGLNGYEVARELRRDGREERILLVALTGYGRDEDRRRSQQAGFDHHLIKPVDPSTLKELLAELHPSPM